MTIEKIREKTAAYHDEFLSGLFTFIRQKSISATGEGIRETSEMVKEMMEEAGLEAREIKTAGHPVIYGEMMDPENDFTLLIYGHYDVQPADPVELWDSEPFKPEIRDGRIYGRGAGDNKGQCYAQLCALKIYRETFGRLPVNIKMVIEGEEETGSPNLPVFVEAHKELLQADLVYTSDGPMHDSGRPFVLTGVRGLVYFELEARGAEWDNHSGNKGNIVPNPAWELVDLLGTMRDKTGRVLIEGFHDDVRQPAKGELEALEDLPYDNAQLGRMIGFPGLDMTGGEYYRRLTLEPTFNIAGFDSGYTGEGAKTIIPSRAMVKIDTRLVADQDPDDIYEKIEAHIKKHAPGVKITKLGQMAPSRTPHDSAVVQTVKNAIEEAYGSAPVMQPAMGGSVPDYVWTTILGAESVIVPYANFDEANHSPNENIGVENFFGGIIATCSVINSLGKINLN